MIAILLAALELAASSATEAPLPVRGIHLAAPSKADLELALAFVRTALPAQGANVLILEFGYDFDFRSRPEFASPSSLGAEEVRRIAAACSEVGIELIPQINCLGHQSWSKRNGRLLEKHPEFDETPGKYPENQGIYCRSYCPLHPGVHAVLFDLVDELARACGARSFHVGMDEVFILADPDCPRCAGKDPADLFAGEVKVLHEHLRAIGCRMWMWGDRFIDGASTGIGKWEASLNGTHRAVDLVPKDIVVCDWHYEKAHDTPRFFAEKGFSVVACPWRKPEVALGQLEKIRAIRSGPDPALAARALGVVQTTWCGFAAFARAWEAEARARGAPGGPAPPEAPQGAAAEAARTFGELFGAIRAAPGPRSPGGERASVLLEAEAFETLGGWVEDSQFMDVMGSPFLLAHGLGVPVVDARTTATFPAAGTYRVWVRTRDWVAPWGAPGAPGRFQVVVGETALSTVFGAEGAEWHWEDGGTVEIREARVPVALRDLTGFEGRADAILFAPPDAPRPPDSGPELAALRRKLLGLPAEPADGGAYDLVVVGGGIAGMCAALSAARLGLEVALVQDRRVLGGNNSSEVRVWLGGARNVPPWPRVGDVAAELEPARRAHYGPENVAEIYEDERRAALLRAEERLRLFLGHRADGVEMDGRRIRAALATETRTGRRVRFAGRWFADSTGDGCLGHLAGADGELTPKGRMGASNLWHVVDAGTPSPFPRCPWAVDLSAKPFPGRGKTEDDLRKLGVWYWESGFDRDPIREAEVVRDANLRAMYGAWDALKNVDGAFPNHRLAWAAYVAGKRESRRILGDVVLAKEDLLESRAYPDGCVPTGWKIDLHLPDPRYVEGFEGDPFISEAHFTDYPQPYWIPYRCLYSRSVPNLFVAGRAISVTHEALGAVRVMRTCGCMGEIVGMAAAISKRHGTDPRGVYEHHLRELQDLMARGASRDAYGGWTAIRFEATGFFRVAERDGVSWLVTPEGNAFISKGVNHVSFRADHAPALGHSPYERAVRAKYGSEEAWAKAAVDRLRAWGFNTLGSWSSPSAFSQGMAYTLNLDLATRAGADWLKGSVGDFFSEDFESRVEEACKRACAPRASDRWLLGYFTDNELRWGADWRGRLSLLEEYLRLPEGSPGRRKALEFLRERHGGELGDEKLSAGGSREDQEAFLEIAAERYFSVSERAIRKADPNHLILGCRFAGHAPEAVLRGMRKHVDVVSFNHYGPEAPVEALERIRRIAGRPVMLTEFSFKAADSGLPNTRGAGKPVPTQKDRAEGFARYVGGLLDLPFAVGFHWFEHADEPKEGRFDGEDSNYGLVTIEDRPWEALTEAMAALNPALEARHARPSARIPAR